MQKLFLFILLIAVAFGCQKPEEPPVFKGIGNVKVSKVQGSTAFLNADAYFYNPNDVKLNIKNVDIGVSLDGKPIGQINESNKTKVQAKSDFKVPINVTFDLKETGALKNLLSFIGGGKREVRFLGHISVSKYGLPVRVKVDHTEEVSIRF